LAKPANENDEMPQIFEGNKVRLRRITDVDIPPICARLALYVLEHQKDKMRQLLIVIVSALALSGCKTSGYNPLKIESPESWRFNIEELISW
jgi:hypothetical protein